MRSSPLHMNVCHLPVSQVACFEPRYFNPKVTLHILTQCLQSKALGLLQASEESASLVLLSLLCNDLSVIN